MTDREFKLDTTFTGKSKNYARPVGVAVAIVGVVVIVLSLTTNLASRLLPLDDNYLLVLIPTASDGAEPLSLKSVSQTTEGDRMTVTGTVESRSDSTVSGLVAVVQSLDRYGVPGTPVEVAVEPAELPAHGIATFRADLTGVVGAYVVKFRIVDGPFVPHKDERTAAPAPSSR